MSEYLKVHKRFLFSLMTFITAIVFLSFLLTYNSINNVVNENANRNIEKDLKSETGKLQQTIQRMQDLAKGLASQKLLISYLDTHTDHSDLLVPLQQEYLALSEYIDNLMQLRYINEDGLEVIRINRDAPYTNKPYVVPSIHLQNKKHRDYFQQSSHVPEGNIWISPIDLNIENRRIEVPYAPTLRVASPVYVEGSFRGIVIINLHLKSILKRFRSTKLYERVVCDTEGAVLLHKNPKKDWAKFVAPKDNLSSIYADDADAILEQSQYRTDTLFSVQLPIGDHKYIFISEIKSKAYWDRVEQTLAMAIPYFLILIFIIFLLSSLYAIYKARTINNELEEQIDAQVDEIRNKDAILIKQSRHAAMGEMLSIIAHQWRQPLSVISAITAKFRFNIEMEQVTTDNLRDNMSQIETQVNYLSQTITDFRDFFKPDKEIKQCSMTTLLDRVSSIINKTLLQKSIRLITDVPEEITFRSYENELQQILINLINNAKDSITEHNVLEGEISIKAVTSQQNIIITVCDNGGGIPPSVMDRIMEPYFTTKGTNGTGLGLYMCSIIMDLHLHGTIRAYNVDHGACFQLTMPINL